MSNCKLGILAATAIAVFTLGCGGGGSAKNRAPIISSVTFPESANEGDIVNVSVSAEDPDGSIRDYAWTRTYGPTIDFGNTGGGRTAQFTAPQVDSDTALGLLIEVVDNDGAVSQEFMEIIITDTTQLKLVSLSKKQDKSSTSLSIELLFDKEPLLNSILDYAEPCYSAIVISSVNMSGCHSFTYKLTSETSLQLELESVDYSQSYSMTISDKLMSVREKNTKPIIISNLLDESELKLINEKLKQ